MRAALAARFVLASLVLPAPALAQLDALFGDDFEFGDTGDWSATVPPRCDEIRPFDRDVSPTAWIHVAPPPVGNDATGDGSPGAPFASIQHAAGLANPGTAVRLSPGTHLSDQFVSDLEGDAIAPVWIGGEPGRLPKPVIAGGGEALHLARAKWLVVHDLEIHSSTANGINADDGGETANPLASHHLVFRRLAIHDIGSGGNNDCLKLSGIYDLWLLDSTHRALRRWLGQRRSTASAATRDSSRATSSSSFWATPCRRKAAAPISSCAGTGSFRPASAPSTSADRPASPSFARRYRRPCRTPRRATSGRSAI